MDTLTRAYRAQNVALRAQTIRDLQKLWPALDFRQLERTYPAWFSGVSVLLRRDRSRSAALASLYLRAHRLQAGIPGEPDLRLAEALLPAEQVATSLRVTTIVAVRRSQAAGKSIEQARLDAFVQSTGAVSRMVLNAGRDTVIHTALADPKTKGWRRVTSSGCDFCKMLASRGAVYSEANVRFASHDHCVCSAEPAYGGESLKVDAFRPSARRFASEEAHAANNARIREWIRTHNVG